MGIQGVDKRMDRRCGLQPHVFQGSRAVANRTYDVNPLKPVEPGFVPSIERWSRRAIT